MKETTAAVIYVLSPLMQTACSKSANRRSDGEVLSPQTLAEVEELLNPLLNSKQGLGSCPLEIALGYMKSVRARISEP